MTDEERTNLVNRVITAKRQEAEERRAELERARRHAAAKYQADRETFVDSETGVHHKKGPDGERMPVHRHGVPDREFIRGVGPVRPTTGRYGTSPAPSWRSRPPV